VSPACGVSLEGLREAIEVALLYIDAWIRQEGVVNRGGNVEDLATAEICRVRLVTIPWFYEYALFECSANLTAFV